MLVDAAVKKLKRALGKQVRYEDGHFDGVITRYRECSATDWGPGLEPSTAAVAAVVSTPTSDTTTTTTARSRPERSSPREIMTSIQQEFFPRQWKWVAPHILELEAGKGGIKPHVDHLEASGEVVAGLCLGSTAVMELIHEDNPDKSFRVLLPKGCFYFQRDSVRYHYKHGIPILPQDHQFKGTVIPKERRISIMLRVCYFLSVIYHTEDQSNLLESHCSNPYVFIGTDRTPSNPHALMDEACRLFVITTTHSKTPNLFIASATGSVFQFSSLHGGYCLEFHRRAVQGPITE